MLDATFLIMKIACIDLDNTLADTSKMHLIAFKQAFSNYNLKPVSGKRILDLFGLVSEDMIKKLYPDIKKKLAEKITKEHNLIATTKTYKYARQIKGADAALKYLKSKGYKIVIVSNSSMKEVKTVLRQTRIKNYDTIIAKEQVKRGKPAADGINLAKKIFNSKDAIMIGDTTYDILAGKKAKVKTIAVLTGDDSKKKLMQYNPDYIIKSIAEIKGMFK